MAIVEAPGCLRHPTAICKAVIKGKFRKQNYSVRYLVFFFQ